MSKGFLMAAGSIFIFLFILIGTYYLNLFTQSREAVSKSQKYRYAYETINIRSGRGIDFNIIGKLYRGDKVKADNLVNGWVRVLDESDNKLGYVYAELLKHVPIPDYEIVDWNWHKDPDFGENGSIIFDVRVRNNTSKSVRSVKIEFATFDANGKIVNTKSTFVFGLPPGGIGSQKGYATYVGTEKTAMIRIDRSK